MGRIFKDFARETSGTVTVDWVLLTAGMVGLAMAVVYPIMTESVSWGENLANLVSEETSK